MSTLRNFSRFKASIKNPGAAVTAKADIKFEAAYPAVVNAIDSISDKVKKIAAMNPNPAFQKAVQTLDKLSLVLNINAPKATTHAVSQDEPKAAENNSPRFF